MIEQHLIGGQRNFTYLVSFDGEAIVIDPQKDLKPWQQSLIEQNCALKGIAITHTHWDHVEGVLPILKLPEYAALPVYLHEKEARRLKKYPEDVRARFTLIKDGDVIEVGTSKLEVFHTPGHSGGECCFYLHAVTPVRIYGMDVASKLPNDSHLFTGDTVFVGEVGRTDLETGSTEELFHTLQRLKKLPPQTIIYPGHHYGITPTSTIERECRQSAAFKCSSVEELDAIP